MSLQYFINIMEKLKVGDTFFLCKDVFVMVGSYCVQSGRVYDKGRDHSETRNSLKESICDFLYKNQVKYDGSIVDRFVNFIAKDEPAGQVRLEPGNFVVTHITPCGANEETVHCHRVGDPYDRVEFDQNKTYGHYRFEAIG